VGRPDAIEAAFAAAITKAAAAGQWQLVSQLAHEVEQRRLAREGSKVVDLRPRGRSVADRGERRADLPAPVSIGPANAELRTGVPWRYLKTRFPHLVRAIGERKSVILARDLERELAGRDPRDEAAGGVEELAADLGVVLDAEKPER
jgi:hypothetical protein